jgi:hypothetical protein
MMHGQTQIKFIVKGMRPVKVGFSTWILKIFIKYDYSTFILQLARHVSIFVSLSMASEHPAIELRVFMYCSHNEFW